MCSKTFEDSEDECECNCNRRDRRNRRSPGNERLFVEERLMPPPPPPPPSPPPPPLQEDGENNEPRNALTIRRPLSRAPPPAPAGPRGPRPVSALAEMIAALREVREMYRMLSGEFRQDAAREIGDLMTAEGSRMVQTWRGTTGNLRVIRDPGGRTLDFRRPYSDYVVLPLQAGQRERPTELVSAVMILRIRMNERFEVDCVIVHSDSRSRVMRLF